jgi:hypothetical protein
MGSGWRYKLTSYTSFVKELLWEIVLDFVSLSNVLDVHSNYYTTFMSDTKLRHRKAIAWLSNPMIHFS